MYRWREREHRDDVLTAREREIVDLISRGLSNKEVGRQLNLQEGTIKVHLHNIYTKLEVSNRTALVRDCVQALRRLLGQSESDCSYSVFRQPPLEPAQGPMLICAGTETRGATRRNRRSGCSRRPLRLLQRPRRSR